MAPSTGNIERVLIELRPRLQSANFFISFRRKFAEIDSTTIDLAHDRLTIGAKGEHEKYEIRVGDFFKLHTQTLSSLVIKNQYLCFRVNTNESDFGSELLGFQHDGSTPIADDLSRLLCNIESGKRYRLLCNNCRGPMDDATEGILFNRVLELPSEQMDSDDWFCHRHDHQHQQGEPQGSEQLPHESGDYKSKLEPQRNDLLFGSFYALLHRSVLPRIHIRNNRFLYCKRCLQYLGTTRKNSSSVKLWYEHIRFQQMDSNEQLVQSLFNTTDSLELFRQLVRKTVREFNIVSSFGLPPMMKLMFELRRPGLEGDVFYLLLQIMDSQLSVFRIDQKRFDEASGGSCSDDVDDQRRKLIVTKENGERSESNGNHTNCPAEKEMNKNEDHHDSDEDGDDDDDVFIESRCQRHSIHLEQQRAMKLMYQYEKYEQQPLFNLWREDSNVVSLEISEPMFSAAIHYLDRNSSYVPECYRVNLGFTLSYLDIT
uniref:E3 ubiquitin-protein ligase E3D n=1 Tax=Anopheles braziliensis TaxID=58242 RepID=A0A2M3Z2G6_9DIPT